jgi:hypothetical protein
MQRATFHDHWYESCENGKDYPPLVRTAKSGLGSSLLARMNSGGIGGTIEPDSFSKACMYALSTASLGDPVLRKVPFGMPIAVEL